MLSYLRIRGIALLDDVALEFSPGMNVLTGETGAGKSIIVDALALLRGGRAHKGLVREGGERAEVDGCFDVPNELQDELGTMLGDDDLDFEEGLVVRRHVGRGGRGRSFIQGNLTTAGLLARVGERLVDICSQHEHHSLTDVSSHIRLLDAYAGHAAEVEAYRSRHKELRTARSALAELHERASEAGARADYLRFQIQEIERVSPEPGEDEEVRGRVTLMREANRWSAFVDGARCALYEDDDAIASRLAGLIEEARRGGANSALLEQLNEQLVAAQVACEEAAALATRLGRELSFEPADLERDEERLHELESLKRKHGIELADVESRLATMREELEAIEHSGEHAQALEARLEEIEADCRKRAAKLTRARRRAALDFAEAIETRLKSLHMPDARIEAELSPLPELGPSGADAVEFRFSANRGESLAPLTRVASGGELSRVLLALKGVLATGDRVATYVFDEVDAGVGGAVAEAIGQQLRAAAQEHQVLCITHLPQIAAFADAHYQVVKTAEAGRTVTRVRRLSDDERVEELARMLGGARVTATAKDHAAQLIRDAHV